MRIANVKDIWCVNEVFQFKVNIRRSRIGAKSNSLPFKSNHIVGIGISHGEVVVWKDEVIKIGENGYISGVLERELAIVLLVVTAAIANELVGYRREDALRSISPSYSPVNNNSRQRTYAISGHLQSRRVSWRAEENHAEGQDVWEEKDGVIKVASGDGD